MAEENSLAVEIAKLRERVMHAVKIGMLKKDSKDFYEATLVQVLRECEKNKHKAQKVVEDHKKKIVQAEAQYHAFSQLSSIIYNTMNAFIASQERALREEDMFNKEREEKEAYAKKLEEEAKARDNMVSGEEDSENDTDDKSDSEE